ncbi:MAG: hypothetical protein JO208_12330, partial [Alphaproteobacteria bacterium]|nr:hypothetical protein [Alphaproteobacteria bacterium]
SANVEHAFFGPLDGSSWTTFDAPFDGTTGTEARSINDDGAIVGIATNPKFKVGEEFYRAPDGTFTVFEKDGQPLDGIAQGLDDDDLNVGDYIKPNEKIVGYLGQNGKYSKDFLLRQGYKDFPQISPRGRITAGNTIYVVGFLVNPQGGQSVFIYDKVPRLHAHTREIGHPDATGTALEGINKSLVASGQWTNSAGHSHGFTYRLHNGNYVDLDPLDGSTSQQAWGINDHNLVALSTSSGTSYIYCPRIVDKCPAQGLTHPRRRGQNTGVHPESETR